MTVLGPVDPAVLGVTLPHEHLLIDQGEGPAKRLDDLDAQVDELRLFAAAGGGCVVDVTPPELGRSRAGLRELSLRAGVHVVMGAGHFLARHQSPQTRAASVDELADELAAEVAGGAGVIGELGLDWPHAPEEERVLAAAARVSRETGSAISVHPGRHASSPRRVLEVVAAEGGDPGRVVVGHVERTVGTLSELVALASDGCYLEFDLFGREAPPMPSDETRVETIMRLAEAGHADRLLVSHDTAAPADLKRNGGPGYTHILENIVPVLRQRGADRGLIDRVLISNPARMLAMPGRAVEVTG